MNQSLFVQNLYLYPIKSLGGISVQEAEVEERGFKYDRRWMLVDEAGEFLTQRQHPQLALLQVALGESELAVFSKVDPSRKISFDLEMNSGKEMQVSVWGDGVAALQVAPEVSTWFSDFLGMNVDLVRMPESSHRKLDPRYAVQEESVSFADGEKGTKGKEPLATLATYRSQGSKVYFGQNAVALTQGIVRVGDPIQRL